MIKWDLSLECKEWFNRSKYISVMNHINRMKGKSHIIILIDTEKALDKIQYLFMLKTLDKVGTEGMYLNIIKTIYNKLTANVNLS